MSRKTEKKNEPKPTPVERPKRFEEDRPRDFDSVGRPIAEAPVVSAPAPPVSASPVACPICGSVMTSNRCPIDGHQLVDSP